MSKQISGKVFSISQNENTKNAAVPQKRIQQERKVFDSFFASPKTMLEADVDTGVMRSNICRYVGKWRKYGQVEIVRKRFCHITGHLAAELTTNAALFAPKAQQLGLFNNTGEAAKSW